MLRSAGLSQGQGMCVAQNVEGVNVAGAGRKLVVDRVAVMYAARDAELGRVDHVHCLHGTKVGCGQMGHVKQLTQQIQFHADARQQTSRPFPRLCR